MARQTRADRRARREARDRQGGNQQAPNQQAGAPPRRPDGQAAVNGGRGIPEPRPEASAHAVHHEQHRGPLRFFRESWGELQKVEWPNQNQLLQGVVVVLIACIIVGVYLWLADLAFKRLVQHVFLGQ